MTSGEGGKSNRSGTNRMVTAIKIAPSILAADILHLEDQVSQALQGGAEYIHLDIMDGVFVPGLSFGPLLVEALTGLVHRAGALVDVHLMVDNPERFVPAFAQAGADILTIHIESSRDPLGTLKYIHAMGRRAGLTLKPKTPLLAIQAALPKADLVLVMSVEPGAGGQIYLPQSTPRIKRIRELLDEAGSTAELEVDGGINPESAAVAAQAGASVLVAGEFDLPVPRGDRRIDPRPAGGGRMTPGAMADTPAFPFGKNPSELLAVLGLLVEKTASIRGVESLLPDLLETAQKFSGMESAAVFLSGDGGEVLQLMVETGIPPAPEGRCQRMITGEGVSGRAYQSRRTVMVADAAQEPILGDRVQALGFRSQISLPLMSSGQVLGVLDLNGQEPRAFTAEETAWLESLAGHISVLLFGSRLFVQSQSAAVQLTRLYDFSSRIMSATTLAQALELTARYALLATTANSAMVYLIDSAGKIELHYGVDNAGHEILDEATPCPAGLLQEVSSGAKPVVMQPADFKDPRDIECLEGKGIQTIIALPLRARTQYIGALLVRYSLKHDFAQAELDGLTLYAVQSAGTIERLRLLEESRQRESDLRLIVDMTRVVTSTLDLEELLQQIAVLLVWTARMDACAIFSVDSEHNQIRTMAAYSAFGERADADFGSGFALSDFPVSQQVLKGSDPLLLRVDDPRCHPSEAAVLRHLHYGAVLMIPLWAGGKALGMVKLYCRRDDRVLTPMELQRLRLPAEQAALALVNARLYESEREQRILAETLRDIGLTLSGSLKTPDLLDTLLEQIGRVVPYDSASVMLLQGDRVKVAAHRGYDRFGLSEWIAHLDVPIEKLAGIQRMARTRRPHVIPDVLTDPTWQAVGPAWHVGSWVGAPLVTRNQLLGFLSMDKSERGFYNSDHAERLGSLAGHAALALLNALTFGEVEQASITDFVTGIFNRRYFQEQLQLELDRARRIGYPVSLLIFDIDHFKIVNDSYGHPVGDQVLQMVASRIKDELRAVDVLARYGGEEFAVILPGTPGSSLAGVGERLRQVIALRPFVVDEQEITITVSGGGATFPGDADEAQALIDGADQWLYKAKESGRNRVRVPEPMPWPNTDEPAADKPADAVGGEVDSK